MNQSQRMQEDLGATSEAKGFTGRDLVAAVEKFGASAMITNVSLAIRELHVGEGRQMGKGAPTPSGDQKAWLKVISKLSEATALASNADKVKR